MPTRRQERVAKRVVQELVDALRNLKHVNLGFVTITRCEISPDLRHARMFVSIFGDEAAQEKGLETLKRNAPKLRSLIARPLGTKVIPDLHFEFDGSLATADRISRLIREARQTDSNPQPLTAEEAEALRVAGAPAESIRAGGAVEDAASGGQAMNPFDAVRREVEEDLYGLDDEDDPDWKPVNLDELPDDDDEDK